jgi:hypothetical protein
MREIDACFDRGGLRDGRDWMLGRVCGAHAVGHYADGAG